MAPDRPGGDWQGTVKKVLVPGPPELEVACPDCGAHFTAVDGGPVRIHVILNRDSTGRVVEIFTHNVPPGARALSNALSRLISKALQVGVPVEDVARMLKSQHEGYPPVRWGEAGLVTSLPDALARLLVGGAFIEGGV